MSCPKVPGRLVPGLLALVFALGSVACRGLGPHGLGKDGQVSETELRLLHVDDDSEIYAGHYRGLFVLSMKSASRNDGEQEDDLWLGNCDMRRWIDRNGNRSRDPGEPLGGAGRQDADLTSFFYFHSPDVLVDEDGPEWIEIDYVVRGEPRRLGPRRLR